MKSPDKFSREAHERLAQEFLELGLQTVVPEQCAALKSRPRPSILVVEEADAEDEPVRNFYTLH